MKPYYRGISIYPKSARSVKPHDPVDMINPIYIDLTGREVELLLAHTSPFDDEREQLKRFAGKAGTHRLKTDDFYLSGLLADINHSSKDIYDEGLSDELDDLFTRLDIAFSAGTRR